MLMEVKIFNFSEFHILLVLMGLFNECDVAHYYGSLV